MAEELKCISCGTHIKIGNGSVKYPCPKCGEEIGRCKRCRDLGRKYEHECGMEGP